MKQLKLYLTDVRPLAERESAALALLPPSRRSRAEAIRVESDRLHCMGAGLLLRQVLDVNSDDALEIGEQGKPAMPGGPCFNLTHGGNYVALAVFHASVGVDVEPVTERLPIIPRRFLRPDELNWLEAEPTPARFAWLWTRLESALKADGRGFALEERSFSVLTDGAWYIKTLEHDGHILSCAAGEPFAVELIFLSAEELLT